MRTDLSDGPAGARGPSTTQLRRAGAAGGGARGPSRRRSLLGALRADRGLVALDALVVGLAHVVALVLRFDGDVPARYWDRLPPFLLLAVVVHLTSLTAWGMYGRVWLQAGVAEVRPLLLSAGAATTTLVAAVAVSGDQRIVPLSVPLNGGALALLLFAGTRYRGRLADSRRVPPADGTGVVLVGSVAAARNVIAQVHGDERTHLVPLAVVTDEVTAWGRSLWGVRVTGPVDQLPEVAAALGAEVALFVLDHDPVALQHAVDVARSAGLQPKVLPSLYETMGRRPGLRDVRDLSVEDLLGREQVRVDVDALRETITGRRVMITGAGGSIGSEIAAQVSLLEPAELVLLDHDETHLHDAVARLTRPAVSVLGDIREEAFVMGLFARHRPEVVFHAAAHKHVPILEDFPSEAVRTNVLGTQLLVRAAAVHGTGRFVAISTDKAVEPSSVMGASKRLAEQVLVLGRPDGSPYCAVRFGNVLGSRGSVVPTFLRQVEHGGPLTVTHPDVTRFFMTVSEAVTLVMQAAALSTGGEVFMLDMGEPVRIADLAERVIQLVGNRPGDAIRIEYTGLRPGEKMEEVLHSEDETVDRTAHPKIHLVRSPECARELLLCGIDELSRLARARDEAQTRRLLLELASLPAEVRLDGAVLPALRRATVAAGSASVGSRP